MAGVGARSSARSGKYRRGQSDFSTPTRQKLREHFDKGLAYAFESPWPSLGVGIQVLKYIGWQPGCSLARTTNVSRALPSAFSPPVFSHTEHALSGRAPPNQSDTNLNSESEGSQQSPFWQLAPTGYFGTAAFMFYFELTTPRHAVTKERPLPSGSELYDNGSLVPMLIKPHYNALQFSRGTTET